MALNMHMQASGAEVDGSRRYLPSYLRESAGPKAV